MKLTTEQRREAIAILTTMLCDTKKNKDRLSKPNKWYDKADESIVEYFTETINDIINLINQLETDKDFELSPDFLRTAFIYQIASTKNKDTLAKLNNGYKGFYGKK